MSNCIYCGSLGPFKSVEHVFPYSLGGGGQGWTLQNVVCDTCNNKFSALEEELARPSLVALARSRYGPQGRKKSQKHPNPLHAKGIYRFSEDNDLAYETGVSLGFKPYTRSQLIEDQIIGSESIIQSIKPTDREEEFSELLTRANKFINEEFYLVDKKITLPSQPFQVTKLKYNVATTRINEIEKVSQSRPPKENCVWLQSLPVDSDKKRYTPRIFLDDKDKLIVKAHNLQEAVRFLETIVTFIIDKTSNEEKGEIPEIRLSDMHIDMKFNLISVSRAIAKIGVNFSIKVYGEEFMRDSAFDEIKAFIKGEFCNNLDIARQYVEMNPKINPFNYFSSAGDIDKHWMMLFYMPNQYLIFTIQLYESIRYLVRLGNKKPPIDHENFEVAIVYYEKREINLLNPTEIAKLVVLKNR